MINFVVVDDNSIHRKKVNNSIISFMMRNKIEFNIQNFDDYKNELLDYVRKNKKDSVYILDLELPNGDGIDIARKIRYENNDWSSPIIIVTAHSSLRYEVYKHRLQILDFIAKCDNPEQNIKENLEICLKMLNKEKVYRYTYNNIEYTINLCNIDYIQRNDRRVKIITKEKDYYQNTSINIIKKSLPDNFLISSKGTIINMKNVSKIDWNTLKVYFFDGKSDYLVSRSHKKEINKYELN